MSELKNIKDLPEWVRKIAAQMYPQITKTSYSQWEVERLLLKVCDECESKLHEVEAKAKREERELVKVNIGYLRQWINEISTTHLVTNEEIEEWLFTKRIITSIPNDESEKG